MDTMVKKKQKQEQSTICSLFDGIANVEYHDRQVKLYWGLDGTCSYMY